jgi:hypothetical protein
MPKPFPDVEFILEFLQKKAMAVPKLGKRRFTLSIKSNEASGGPTLYPQMKCRSPDEFTLPLAVV